MTQFFKTKPKKAENALQESVVIYRALIETTGTGYVIIDTESKVIDANAEYVRLTGHANLNEIRGRSVIEWTADYEKKKNAEAVAKCAKDGYIRNLEIDYIDKRGKITPVEINATVVEKSGTPQILTLCRDITERKNLERKLDEYTKSLEQKVFDRMKDLEKEKIAARNVYEDLQTEKEIIAQTQAIDEAILASIADGCIAVNKNGKITLINQMAQKMLGFSSQESIGREWPEILRREDEKGNLIAPEKGAIHAALSIATTTITSSYYLRKDGTKFPVSRTVSPILLQGKIIGAVNIFRDITKEKEIEKMRMDFLSLASHQLRTPLSGTKWLIETIQKGITGKLNPKQKEYLDNIYQVNERMIKLVSDMLNVLMLESGIAEIKKQEIPISKLSEELFLIMEPASRNKGVILHNALKNNKSLFLETDPQILRSALECFVSNAINYSQSGQEVVLDAEEKPDAIIFSIKDSGIGIPKGEQKKLFERFYRASNAKILRPTGTGLGLNIAKMLAEKIGAEISFESEENKGSIFYLRIPKRSSKGAGTKSNNKN
ncbi:hypothetical protein COV49_00380 [Candidatus Falkowbacteria bacterium CG11_big_fil_rev_8_21_14_0_20_39_10]|uniref:histidine kinase n=1 Tax=Candidatus Falkowbacteria bacterium CG11_big_fil_rev_8_21_14_0_20_39_10 TaxID=1974570 RepID=A0A2M6KA28_9BACT|nr:MAG: hypothetical protein COV49_00380 [Candidatus Falkowbacteria bacterium CG11_big_fil_rev_8_21_14_0_20_39_10]